MEEILIIGEGEGFLSLRDVARTLEASTISFAQLLQNWKSFARSLDINEISIADTERKVNFGTLQYINVPHELLNLWISQKAYDATLGALCKALEDSGVVDLAVTLKTKFGEINPVKSIKLKVHGKVHTLGRLVGEDASNKIYQTVRDKPHLLSLFYQAVELIKEQLLPMDKPKYYISREFLYRSELNKKIFTELLDQEHIFLVKGITKPTLARITGYKPIDISGNQLNAITVQFIVLECEEDFERISRNTTNPVHMLEYKNNSFFWLKSSRGLKALKYYLKPEGLTFKEEDAVKMIKSLRFPAALSIADTPGMGKTIVLANLAATIIENMSNETLIFLFIVFEEFVRQIKQTNLTSLSAALDAICVYATPNHFSNLILQEMLKRGEYKLYLFLDGYDEVLQDKLGLADEFLQLIRNLPYVKIIVTTRPHLKARLENILNRLSFEILPFTETNQIEFLKRYWVSQHEAEDNSNLDQFARECLTALKKKMTDKEADIAGVPLQCMILAEVHAEDAKRASKLETFSVDGAEKSMSFFEMYKSLIQLKLKRVTNILGMQKYVDAHIYDSIALLFPAWQEKFGCLLSPREEADENTIYSIGLIEKSPFTNAPRFLHRTIAENFLALFIVRNLAKSETCVEFLFTEILGKSGTMRDSTERIAIRPTAYRLKHSVVAYFVEMHLKDNLNAINFSIALTSSNIKEEDLCIAANACCCHDLENCYDLTEQILPKPKIKTNQDFLDKYFKLLPLLVVEQTENVTLLRRVLNLTQLELGVDLSWHVFDGYYFFTNYFKLPDCTPLHLAVYHGKYNMVTYLLKQYGESALSLKYLLHCCVSKSAFNTESVIQNKLSIIGCLVQLNRKWLEENFPREESVYIRSEYPTDDTKPILQCDVHLKLIQCLIELGVDINTHDDVNGTILHTGGSDSTYPDLLRWALSNGFALINQQNQFKDTPLSSAIFRLKILDDDTLSWFKDAGADFNAKNYSGNSILFCAIEYSKNVKFLEKVLDFGADVNHQNNEGENAAHFVISHYRDEPTIAVDLLKLLDSRGFSKLHEGNDKGDTAFKYLVAYQNVDEEILEYFVKAGSDDQGNSILFKCIELNQPVDLIQRVLNLGDDVNHENKAGENAAHFVFKFCKRNPKFVLALSTIKFLESVGFDKFKAKDHDGHTPSEYAVANEILDDEILKYLVEVGEDEDGNVILFHAIKYSKDEEILLKILNLGVEPNHVNKKGQNAAHFVIEHYQRDQRALKLIETYQINETSLICILGPGDPKRLHESRRFKPSSLQDDNGYSLLGFIEWNLKNAIPIIDHEYYDFARVIFKAKYRFRINPRIYINMLNLLISRGFEGFNQKDHDGKTPLRTAMIQGMLDLGDEILCLFSKTAPDEDGNTMLFHALQCSKDQNFITKILNFSVNLNHQNNHGENIAHLAMKHYPNDAKLAFNLLKLFHSVGFNEFDRIDHNGETPLMIGIFHSNVNLEILNFFCKTGANLYSANSAGDSILFYAVKYSNNFDLIQATMKFGASLNHVNNYGENAAHLVVKYRNNQPILATSLINLFTQNGFQGLNQKNKNRVTPIQMAMEAGITDEGLLQLFLEAGADEDGDTVLFHAIRQTDDVVFIHKILDFGADLGHQNNKGENAVHLVVRHKNTNIDLALTLLKLFEAYGFKGINQSDNDGKSPLMSAVMAGLVLDDDILQFFYETGANFNAQDKHGDSVLSYAIWYSKSLDVVRRILNFGANSNLTNQFQENAAHCIVRNKHYHDNPCLALKMLELLESEGFNGYRQKDQDGFTPLMIAKKLKIRDDKLLKYLQGRDHKCSVQ